MGNIWAQTKISVLTSEETVGFFIGSVWLLIGSEGVLIGSVEIMKLWDSDRGDLIVTWLKYMPPFSVLFCGFYKEIVLNL